jgi:hypothetical protein
VEEVHRDRIPHIDLRRRAEHTQTHGGRADAGVHTYRATTVQHRLSLSAQRALFDPNRACKSLLWPFSNNRRRRGREP